MIELRNSTPSIRHRTFIRFLPNTFSTSKGASIIALFPAGVFFTRASKVCAGMFVPKNNSIPRPVTADERTSDFDLLEVLLNLLSDPVVNNPHRKLIVLTSLVTVLTVTSALLLALAPPPLAAQTPYDSLSAEDSVGNASDLIDAIFNTRVPAR